MKKSIFTLVLVYASVVVFAQGLGVGIKAGANFANLSTDNFSNSSITSYHAGVYANINFSEKWGVTPEVLWSAQGAELNNLKLKTDFVTVPIMIRWRVIELISLEAGPQFNFLTSADLDGNDVKDDLKNNTYSVAVGALVHLPLGLNGGVRYIIGMTDLTEDDSNELKDRTFQIYVGWTLFGAK
ncbi:MAG TPA: porin family protein [Chryseolinea sp.]